MTTEHVIVFQIWKYGLANIVGVFFAEATSFLVSKKTASDVASSPKMDIDEAQHKYAIHAACREGQSMHSFHHPIQNRHF